MLPRRQLKRCANASATIAAVKRPDALPAGPRNRRLYLPDRCRPVRQTSPEPRRRRPSSAVPAFEYGLPGPQQWPLGSPAGQKDCCQPLLSRFFPPIAVFVASPLFNISRLPVCDDCLILRPLTGSLCAVCGEALPYAIVPGYACGPSDARCGLCRLRCNRHLSGRSPTAATRSLRDLFTC